MDEIVTLLIDDDDKSWVEGVFANEDAAREHFRGYLVTRFGIDEVGKAESGDNGLGALVPYRLDFWTTPA
ncbi:MULTISPECIES: hypothetical protein [Mycobacterium avium complex (MAC)]|uniref:hypothetical protein n=1 Tax=Mycobacterium avium complex (MAC) TaxID=120793 RepID=UPI0009FF1DD4|nr:MULTISPECIES: hypothetical protein [Mycobacterium avium complex (MAC)]UCN12575.1 hypothetical protein LFT50_29210 [Mycobacterium intracellulare subsp. chimaera]